jgi:hypothetical protein
MPGIKMVGNSVEVKAAVRYVMSTVKTTIPAVVVGVLKPRDWRRSGGGKWRRDIWTRRALWLVAVEIGGKGKSPLDRASSAADPRKMMESRRG